MLPIPPFPIHLEGLGESDSSDPFISERIPPSLLLHNPPIT